MVTTNLYLLPALPRGRPRLPVTGFCVSAWVVVFTCTMNPVQAVKLAHFGCTKPTYLLSAAT